MKCPIGVGLRPTHYSYLESLTPTKIQWFEIISENYMDSRGRPLEVLEFIRSRFPVACHGVSLSLGSTDSLNENYLKKLKLLVERIDPWIVSDHCCWTGAHSKNLHDLLPLPYTQEVIEHLVSRIQLVQDYLGRNIAIENVSTYFQFPESEYTEWDFLKEVCKRSGCKLLLDVNNVYVNAYNHGFDPKFFLDSIPVEIIGQVHLAGYTDMGAYLFDTHSNPVFPVVWDLFEYLVGRIPKVPILVEWDDDIPEFQTLEAEAMKAVKIWERFHGKNFSNSMDGPTPQRSDSVNLDMK